MQNTFLNSERIKLRYIAQDDFENLKSMLQDLEVMYAWEYEFDDSDVQNWIDKNINLYETCGLGYFIMEEKISGEIIGQAALMPDTINGIQYYEIGYILKKQFWHNGYATESAHMLTEYAFSILGLKEVIFEIRPCNTPSRRVAERLGAKIEGEFIKNVRNKEMVHLIYKLLNPGF